MFHIGLGTNNQLVTSIYQDMLDQAARERADSKAQRGQTGLLSRLLHRRPATTPAMTARQSDAPTRLQATKHVRPLVAASRTNGSR